MTLTCRIANPRSVQRTSFKGVSLNTIIALRAYVTAMSNGK